MIIDDFLKTCIELNLINNIKNKLFIKFFLGEFRVSFLKR